LLLEKEQQFMRQYSEAAAREKALQVRLARSAEREYLLREAFESIQGDLAWRVALMIRRCRCFLAPPDSLRGRALDHLKRLVQVSRKEGLRKLLTRGFRKSLVPTQCLPVLPQRNQAPSFAASETKQPSPSQPTVERDSHLFDELLSITPRQHSGCRASIDIVVPVYKGLNETLRCLRSVLTSCPTAAYELIVINDASPEPALSAWLRDLARRGLITLLENPLNLGFVKTANRGLALHPERDVVLLNSDTEVSRDWLDRLRKAAYSAERVGTVTPFSNNATICSYPTFCADNALPNDTTHVQMDELCAASNDGCYVEVPTGVGFCMYVRRDCLRDVDLLDEEHFGKGYGEENDFCMRATQRGWRHLLATDTFVYHSGGASFGASKNPAIENALKVMDTLYPDYQEVIAGHIAANPALPFRRRLDLARLGGARPTTLYVLHNLGGGTQKHVFNLADRLEKEGRRAIVLRPLDTERISLVCPAVPGTPNLIFHVPGERWTLLAILRELGVDHVHIHHTIDVPHEVLRLIGDLGAPYDWTIHDYYTICPRINLVNGLNRYCGEPDVASCQSCINTNGGSRGERVNVLGWRADYGKWLAGARKVFVPHQDVATRLTRYFPEVPFLERRHFETHTYARRIAAPWSAGEPLRVAIIGALGVHKGNEVLSSCARDALKRELAIRFHLVGDPGCEELFASPNVVITGRYQEREIFDILEGLRCHCAFFPSICPETYSYTLSIAFLGRLWPIAFDLGAPAARIRECGFGHVIPLTSDGPAINDELLAQAPRLAKIPADWDWKPVDYRNLLGEYYGLSLEGDNSRCVA
jgi:GT2 family glycosyltransferase/glycosyltransferase involved in cell wall biosynthesis